jgi:hypothetical protein
MESNTELSAIFKELNLENQANLLRRAQVSRAAENAIRKVAGGQYSPVFEPDYLVVRGRILNTREEFR